MRIAVVGAGISGLTAAYLLSRRHEVTLFERNDRLGGHADTHAVTYVRRPWAIDTAFAIYHEPSAPHLTRLFDELGIQRQPVPLSFGIQCQRCRIAYATHEVIAPASLVRHALHWPHWRLALDASRFRRHARERMRGERPAMPVDDPAAQPFQSYLDAHEYSDAFIRHFLLPILSTIWPVSFARLCALPAPVALDALHAAGATDATTHRAAAAASPWRCVTGGSQTYVDVLQRRFLGCVHTAMPVTRVLRGDGGVLLRTANGGAWRFDKLVLATHADEALAMLADASPDERSALGGVRYADNAMTLHTDDGILPRRRAARAAFNIDVLDCLDMHAPPRVSSDATRLQAIPADFPFLVSLNRTLDERADVLATRGYRHPLLDRDALAARSAIAAINGARHTYYCGAHLGRGRHEDGVASARVVAARLGVDW